MNNNNNNNSSKQILLSVIGVAILVVAVVGVSFAFFTYLSGETTNTVKVGTILFSTDMSNFTFENQFPTTVDNAQTSAVKVSGMTTYSNGIDFRIEVTAINKPVDAEAYPTVTVTVPTNLPAGVTVTPGTVDPDAFIVGTTIASGHINPEVEVDDLEVLNVVAFYDAAKYHISDTAKATLVEKNIITNAVKVISQENWNDLDDYSFTIQVVATQGAN